MVVKMNVNYEAKQPRTKMKVGYWPEYSPINSPHDIKLLDFPNINVGVGRVWISTLKI